MTVGAGSIGAEALLAHQDFVLALARSLLHDEEAARDVAQETWVAALTRPPRSIAALRPWLAQVARSRATDRLRREARRAEQERHTARPVADTSADELNERVALQHRVVAAVLALREPYRTAILRHHYEGLGAADIARLEDVPAGTVRARIHRAHDMLRERLDAEFGGARSGWVGAFGALLEHARMPPAAAPSWLAVATVAGAALAIPAGLWFGAPDERAPLVARVPEVVTTAPPRGLPPDLDPPAAAPGRVPLGAASASVAIAADPFGEESRGPGQKAARTKGALPAIANGDFEDKAGAEGAIPGWDVVVGATHDAEEPLSIVRMDTKEKRAGRASLLLSGDDTTRAWRSPRQTIEARPGGTYRMRAWARVKDVRQETVRGTQIPQFLNCFVSLLFLDDNGEVVVSDLRRPSLPTSGWQELAIDLTAPDAARTVMVSVSLTMSGSLWIDEISLDVEGGRDPPPKVALVDEDFESVSGLPHGWEAAVRATNGAGSKRSTVAVDRGSGANDSRASLRFSGDRTTIQWLGLERRFDAVPGDSFLMRMQVRAENVRKEGVQFPNLHVRLVFLDVDGKTLGAPKFAQPGIGTFDWKEVSVAGVAPDGAVQVLAGIFLSMSGDAWFDDLHIEKRSGGTPAYGDWLTLDTAHLVLRYPKDHPRASGMKQYGEKLDRAYQDVVRRLGVDYSDRITMYLYRDEFQGKNLTGRDLDFANPEGRAVHQRPNSTLSHEMVHCIALKMGAAQTGLLGEGIAVWLDGGTPDLHHDRAAKLLRKDELPSMQALLESFRDQANGYPAAGSFCGYVIETYGIAKFRELYPTTDPAGASESVLEVSFDQVDAEWRQFLKRRG